MYFFNVEIYNDSCKGQNLICCVQILQGDLLSFCIFIFYFIFFYDNVDRFSNEQIPAEGTQIIFAHIHPLHSPQQVEIECFAQGHLQAVVVGGQDVTPRALSIMFPEVENVT